MMALPATDVLRERVQVREPYSKTIPLFHPIEPMRAEAGFIRPPNIIPGAKPAPQSVLRGVPAPALPETWRLDKLKYDKTALGVTRIPVRRVINAEPPKPSATQQAFIWKPAGLPGGTYLDRSRGK